jgi:hypothetical protein
MFRKENFEGEWLFLAPLVAHMASSTQPQSPLALSPQPRAHSSTWSSATHHIGLRIGSTRRFFSSLSPSQITRAPRLSFRFPNLSPSPVHRTLPAPPRAPYPTCSDLVVALPP